PRDGYVTLDDVVLDPRALDARWAEWNYDGMGRDFLVFMGFDWGGINGDGTAASRWFWGGAGVDAPRPARGGGLAPAGVLEPWELSEKFEATYDAAGVPTYERTITDAEGPVTGKYVTRARFFIGGRQSPAPMYGGARVAEFE